MLPYSGLFMGSRFRLGDFCSVKSAGYSSVVIAYMLYYMAVVYIKSTNNRYDCQKLLSMIYGRCACSCETWPSSAYTAAMYVNMTWVRGHCVPSACIYLM